MFMTTLIMLASVTLALSNPKAFLEGAAIFAFFIAIMCVVYLL